MGYEIVLYTGPKTRRIRKHRPRVDVDIERKAPKAKSPEMKMIEELKNQMKDRNFQFKEAETRKGFAQAMKMIYGFRYDDEPTRTNKVKLEIITRLCEMLEEKEWCGYKRFPKSKVGMDAEWRWELQRTYTYRRPIYF